MSVGIFTDKRHLPSGRQVSVALGRASRDWSDFIRFVEESFGVDGEWKFYGKNYGWALRFRKSGKALVSLYPCARSYTAQMILVEPVVDEARKMKLGKTARAAIEKAHPYPEGRWVFLNVKSRSEAANAKDLLLLKTGRTSGPGK